jgi:hypothetical protein
MVIVGFYPKNYIKDIRFLQVAQINIGVESGSLLYRCSEICV